MSRMEEFKEGITKSIYGITKKEAIEKGICVSCKNPPTFSTELGKKEYPITGICEPCWIKMMTDTEEGEEIGQDNSTQT